MSPAPPAATHARATRSATTVRAGRTAHAGRTPRAGRAARTTRPTRAVRAIRPIRAHRPAPSSRRRAVWPRVLVLLLVLLVPCTHASAQATPVAAAAGANGGAAGGAAGEYDHLDTALRAPARGARRAVVTRSAPAPRLRVRADRVPPLPVPTGTPPASRAPRSVVLRC
ncbi:hypothetical protein ACFQ9U_14870 [Streptomyces sp. NPDC056568]|uniref:hypothetical protein n=1 Tax=Streptomyces sp. NPDC056568 TaxID=3345866 RepID=UPI00369C2B7F